MHHHQWHACITSGECAYAACIIIKVYASVEQHRRRPTHAPSAKSCDLRERDVNQWKVVLANPFKNLTLHVRIK